VKAAFQEIEAAGPNFLGIGAQKAATTWLFKRLSMHEEIYFPGGKEMHYWDRRDRQVSLPIASYVQRFTGKLAKHIGGKLGDITPGYMTISDDRIQEIHSVVPDVRIILVTRNPVDRAISAAAQILRDRGMDASRVSEAEADKILFSRHVIQNGLYAEHLLRWMKIFDRDQILVFDNEDIRRDPKGILRKVSTHLSTNPNYWDLIDIKALAATTSATPHRLRATESQKQRLMARYAASAALLEEVQGRPVGWTSMFRRLAA